MCWCGGMSGGCWRGAMSGGCWRGGMSGGVLAWRYEWWGAGVEV